MPDSMVLRQVHVTESRARLQLEAELDAAAIAALADNLASLPGVKRAVVRPNTGSVIIETDVPVATVMEAVAEAGIARIKPPLSRPPVKQTLQLAMMQADLGVKRQTGNALDLRTTLAVILLGAAMFQLTRGRIVGPAATLLMGALSLMDIDKLAGGKR